MAEFREKKEIGLFEQLRNNLREGDEKAKEEAWDIILDMVGNGEIEGELDLSDCNLGHTKTQQLAQALNSEHCKITSLCLARNKIGPNEAIALA